MDDVLDKLSAVKVLNAIPAPIFIVDRDATVHALNSAARKFVGPEADRSLHRRCGEVLGCMNQHAKPERCGETERCEDCVLRQSLAVLEGGSSLVREKVDMELARGSECEPVVFWVTTSAIELDGEQRALIVLEDISELVQLRELVPICASCKKIRTGDDYWEMVEAYMSKHLDLEFTHGICPDCVEKLYGDDLGSGEEG